MGKEAKGNDCRLKLFNATGFFFIYAEKLAILKEHEKGELK
ncbi:hypothetical protein NY10_351 [Carnobacterium antarcticum]|nr:hypothetical protein NY10_351 [Carnobacterium sp. CP1]